MEISIAERLKPFIHVPGMTVILPGLGWPIQVFPCLLRMYRFQDAIPLQFAELQLELEGPVEQFTVTNDLEKGRLTVSGMTRKGWLRYHLIGSQDLKNVRLVVDRAPSGGLPVQDGSAKVVLQDKEWHDLCKQLSPFTPFALPRIDRLSFGCHKAQDWELVRRRSCLQEIFPFWHRLGQLVPQVPGPPTATGTLALLAECEQLLKQGRPDVAQQIWLNVFLCAFREMLVPQMEDSCYQGIVKSVPLAGSTVSPLVILSEGSRLIRKLLIQQENGSLGILPSLLPVLPFGRLVDVPLEGGGSISIEWSKKTIRRMSIHSTQEREIALTFHSDVRSYRLRDYARDQGERRTRHSQLFLRRDYHYYIDNFD